MAMFTCTFYLIIFDLMVMFWFLYSALLFEGARDALIHYSLVEYYIFKGIFFYNQNIMHKLLLFGGTGNATILLILSHVFFFLMTHEGTLDCSK